MSNLDTFKARAEIITNSMKNFFPAKEAEIASNFYKELSESEARKECLKTGDKIPNFTLKNAFGKDISIQETLKKAKWTVIVFFRGQWCPFCSLELKMLQDRLNEIQNTPATLIAISPQNLSNSYETTQKNALSYEVLSDEGGNIGNLFNVMYTVPEYLNDIYKKNGVDFQYFNGTGKIQLPLPATYIVDATGTIRYHFIEINPAERMEPTDILNFIKNN